MLEMKFSSNLVAGNCKSVDGITVFTYNLEEYRQKNKWYLCVFVHITYIYIMYVIYANTK